MLPLRYAPIWLTAGWALVVAAIAASLAPGVAAAPVLVQDKVAHFVAYFVLMAWFAGIYRPPRYGVIAIGLLGLGLVLEVAQAALLPRRAAELGDLLANAAGIGAGLVVALIGLGGWCQRFERWLVARA